MWPAAHSSGSRTSMTVAPFETCSRTTAGSTSSILLLIWRRTSAPDGIVETPQRQYGFNTSQSIATRWWPGSRLNAPADRALVEVMGAGVLPRAGRVDIGRRPHHGRARM